MRNLVKTIILLTECLQNLDEVMQREQTLLCSGRVNGLALQEITEEKSSLLATVEYLDTERHQQSKSLNLAAPYANNTALSGAWNKISLLCNKLSQLNIHSGMLLQKQMAYNQQALNILRSSQTQKFYGPHGESMSSEPRSRKISI
jgi:flagella synthesis protein FlgN